MKIRSFARCCECRSLCLYGAIRSLEKSGKAGYRQWRETSGMHEPEYRPCSRLKGAPEMERGTDRGEKFGRIGILCACAAFLMKYWKRFCGPAGAEQGKSGENPVQTRYCDVHNRSAMCHCLGREGGREYQSGDLQILLGMDGCEAPRRFRREIVRAFSARMSGGRFHEEQECLFSQCGRVVWRPGGGQNERGIEGAKQAVCHRSCRTGS